MVMEIAISLSRSGLRCRARFYPSRDSGGENTRARVGESPRGSRSLPSSRRTSPLVFPAARRLDGSCVLVLIQRETLDSSEPKGDSGPKTRSDSRKSHQGVGLPANIVGTTELEQPIHGNLVIETTRSDNQFFQMHVIENSRTCAS